MMVKLKVPTQLWVSVRQAVQYVYACLVVTVAALGAGVHC